MSNLEAGPEEIPCHAAPAAGAVVEFHETREVPLGGVRGVMVMRSLPQRSLPTVGAWCFLDLFGPHDTPTSILPHPHIGLQTVTWPFHGEIRHRDSVGSDVVIRPGQLNLMTAGRGIAHSEFGVQGSTGGHGLQLWVALPGSHAAVEPRFEQHRDLPVSEVPGLRATVLMGTLGAATSPATTYTPIVGADIAVDPSATAVLPLRPDFEHAILVVSGGLEVDETDVQAGPLVYLGTGRSSLTLTAGPKGAHAFLLGGEPLREDLVMWWNFVARSHEEIVAARADWENRDVERFADVAGHTPEERIPAPTLPPVRLRPRAHRPDRGRS